MPYFYADGPDKAGNRLLTSYKKEDQARRYRAGSKISQGEKFLAIQEDGGAKLSSQDDGNSLLVRTLMVRPDGASSDEMTGNFVVFARINNKWEQTQFRFKNYASANAAVKSALIQLYSACAVVEMNEMSNHAAAPSTDENEVF